MLKSFETAKTSMRQGEAWALLAFLRVRNACNMYTYYIHIYIYIHICEWGGSPKTHWQLPIKLAS